MILYYIKDLEDLVMLRLVNRTWKAHAEAALKLRLGCLDDFLQLWFNLEPKNTKAQRALWLASNLELDCLLLLLRDYLFPYALQQEFWWNVAELMLLRLQILKN